MSVLIIVLKVANQKKLSLYTHNKNPWYQGFQVINSNWSFRYRYRCICICRVPHKSIFYKVVFNTIVTVLLSGYIFPLNLLLYCIAKRDRKKHPVECLYVRFTKKCKRFYINSSFSLIKLIQNKSAYILLNKNHHM